MDKELIKDRVNDWKIRIKHLYSFVEKQVVAQTNIICKMTRVMTMHEGLMHDFAVDPENIPILDIYKNEKLIVSFNPVALWVLGANGRIDILTIKGSYILVDTAKYCEDPNWKVFSSINRKSGVPFDSKFVIDLVGGS